MNQMLRPPPAAPAAPSPARLDPARGDPTSARGSLAIGLMAAAALVLGVGGWATLASIDGAILAEGQIDASRTRLVIQHPEGGRVADLLVGDGQRVAAGEVLLRLDGGLLAAEHDLVEAQYLEALARAARLTAERDTTADLAIPPGLDPAAAARFEGQRALLQARRESLARQIDQFDRRRAQAEAQRAGLAAQLAALSAERDLAAADLARQEALAEGGHAPSARPNAARRELMRLDGVVAGARAELAALAGRITEIEMQILGLRADRREQAEAGLRDLSVTLVELAARRRALDDRRARLDLRAPAAGRVHALAVGGAGAVLRPAEPVAELIPGPAAPLATIRVRPEDVDRIHPGQPVRVLLPATGGRDRAEIEGHIAQISADALDDPRSGLRHFRAEIALATPLPAPLDSQGLPPGLPVEAQIRTGARSPLAWFMAPIAAQFRRALRED